MHDHKKTDAELQEDVIDELRADSRVDAAAVGVEVRNSVVTLTGSVSSWAKKIAAEDAAYRVSGVLDIANEITVKIAGRPRTDADIATAVRNALQWDAFVPDEKIRSSVEKGVVMLMGEVDTYAQREDAARAVRNLLGVQAIANHITVRRSRVTPNELRAAIRDALERHADRDADKLRIDVEGGRVTLQGNVHSRGEREAVIGAVTGIRGVENVVDQMHIV